jgi:hypothetical protein
MINTYRLDGVDVDCEHFADGADVNTFASSASAASRRS